MEQTLERIGDPDGEGSRTYVKVHRASALAAADAMDQLRSAGLAPSEFAGIPISVKDLFDLAGESTPAGSRVLANAPVARHDAPAIARLRQAGFIVMGRTNMSEFAFSGVGLNPHYGTPASPYDRTTRRIPGGSSSGAAVSVSDGMAFGAIGSDTGGSCRIPAALCDIVGYKPTAAAVSRDGAFPLSTTLDSIGSLANSVECCRILHCVMSGSPIQPGARIDIRGLRIAVPQTVALDGMDSQVAANFTHALETLSRAGALISEQPFEHFAEVARMNAKGGFTAAEAYAAHRQLLETSSADYDPRVRSRIERGRNQGSADYIDLIRARSAFVAAMREEVSAWDVIAMPTVPLIAPPISDLERDDETFTRINLLMLRNSTLINMMDGCALSLPMHRAGEAPSGLTLASFGGNDHRLFAIALAAEAALRTTI